MSARMLEDLTGWFVRRAGLARMTTFACTVGLSLAGISGARPWAALVGLSLSLLAALGGILSLHRGAPTGGRPSLLLVVAVVSVGLFAGYLGGSVRMAALTGGQLKDRVGTVVQGEVIVTGEVRSSAGWQSAIAVVRELRSGSSDPRTAGASQSLDCDEKVLLEVPPAREGPDLALGQGQVLAFTGELGLPDGPSDSGYDQSAYLRTQGVEVVLQADGGELRLLGHRGGVAGWFDRLRSSALTHLGRGPDRRLDEVLQGVVVGETGGIDKSWTESFRRAGTAHMFSVSGLHVASLAALMIGLAGLMRASRGVGFGLAGLAAMFLVPFVGASPPVVRAAVMIVVVLAGRWLGRGRDQWQVLGLAAAVVLTLNPLAVADAGFQLSFAAFVGILALSGVVSRGLRRLPESLRSGLAVSIAAGIGTTPVSLLVFGRTSLISPLANLLVVPVLPAITGLGMASVFLGFVWTGFSTALDFAASIPVAWTVVVSRLFALAPVLGIQHLGRVATAVVLVAAALPAVLTLCGRNVATPWGIRLPFSTRLLRWTRAQKPRERRLVVVLSLFLLAAVAVGGGASYPSLSRAAEAASVLVSRGEWPDGTEVRVLDVGQGSAVLVRTPGHRALLFDGGPAGCALAAQLRRLRVGSVDLAVISHPHADHFAGLLEAVEELQVRALVDDTVLLAPSDPPSSSGVPAGEYGSGEAADYLRLRAYLSEHNSRYARGTTRSRVEVDGVVVRFFAPVSPLAMKVGPEPWGSDPPSGDELNGSSLVCVVSIGTIDILIPGDAEADVLETYELPPVEVVVVPHHGSADALSPRLLQSLGPQVACVSVGEDNSFGHPDPSTVALLAERVGRMLRTDETGWVSFTVMGDQLVLRTERSRSSGTGR
jgi:competence protein ComEC